MDSRGLSLEEFRGLMVPAFRAVFADTDPLGAPFREAVPGRMLLYPVRYWLEDDQIAAVAAAARAVGDGGLYLVMTELWWRDLVESAAPPEPGVITDELREILPPHLLRPLEEAASRGETLEPEAGDYADDPAWYIALDEIEKMREDETYPGTYLETALVSETGRWGILISQDDHAVVGGSETFLEALAAGFPDGESLPGLSPGDPDRPPSPPRDQVVTFLEDVRRHWQGWEEWLPANLEHLYGPQEADRLMRRAGSPV